MSFRFALRGLFGLLVLTLAIVGYTRIMARIAPGTPPAAMAPADQADRIMVSKSDRILYLMRGGRILRRYPIAMGGNHDQGHKQREGDERTPEGVYSIDWRNPRSVAHLSLHISYPNADDRAAAEKAGYSPGGNIMIHGLPNGWGALGRLHLWMDWTDGCIAVTNEQMREIWAMTPDGTPVGIFADWRP